MELENVTIWSRVINNKLNSGKILTFRSHQENIPVSVDGECGHLGLDTVQVCSLYLEQYLEIFETSGSHLLYLVVLDLPEVEDIARPREGDQPALAGQEQNLPQPELLASQVAAQLHPGLPEDPDEARLGDDDQQVEVRVVVHGEGLVGEPVFHILAE